AIDKAPYSPGVYVFRLSGAVCFPRVKGESDIVYIGTTEDGEGTVRKRLIAHHNTFSADDRFWLRRIQTEIGQLEVAWKRLEKHFDAQWIESDLLGRYAREHIEFPPANRQQSLAGV